MVPRRTPMLAPARRDGQGKAFTRHTGCAMVNRRAGQSRPADRRRCPVSHDAAEQTDKYVELQNTEEFADLRRRFRKFVFPMTALFLAWYFLYVLLSTYAPDFMSTKVLGNINVGLILGLGQFLSTFVITMLYARWADRVFDPRAHALHDRMGVDY
jgi:uncharacterized membrane protein (DUF485 family)